MLSAKYGLVSRHRVVLSRPTSLTRYLQKEVSIPRAHRWNHSMHHLPLSQVKQMRYSNYAGMRASRGIRLAFSSLGFILAAQHSSRRSACMQVKWAWIHSRLRLRATGNLAIHLRNKLIHTLLSSGRILRFPPIAELTTQLFHLRLERTLAIQHRPAELVVQPHT